MRFLSKISVVFPGIMGRLISKKTNHPVPGTDWQYHRLCKSCNDFGTHATRGGVRGVQHCYNCGHESEPPNLDDKQAKHHVTSSYCHWRHWPLLPYDWHELSEEAKWRVLGG